MRENIKNILKSFLDAIFPKRSDFAIVESLDAETINRLPKAEPVANMPWITPLLRYKDNRVRAIVWELKFKNNTRPLGHLSSLLYEEMIALVSDIATFDKDARFLLIPIPISALRRSERGYNQSEYICRAIIECDIARTLLYAPQWLEKIKETPEQNKSHSREERLHNLRGCFSADPRIEDSYVLLVDDVVTTGSTLSEARSTLLSAGAKEVYAFTIAH